MVVKDWDYRELKSSAGVVKSLSQLVGVSVNSERTNAIFGRNRCIAGRALLTEQFHGLEFQVRLIRFSKSIRIS